MHKPDAHFLIDNLESTGVQVNAIHRGDHVAVEAEDIDGQVYSVTRDDGDLLAAVREVAGHCGFRF